MTSIPVLVLTIAASQKLHNSEIARYRVWCATTHDTSLSYNDWDIMT
jgi:hypothetical protein